MIGSVSVQNSSEPEPIYEHTSTVLSPEPGCFDLMWFFLYAVHKIFFWSKKCRFLTEKVGSHVAMITEVRFLVAKKTLCFGQGESRAHQSAIEQGWIQRPMKCQQHKCEKVQKHLRWIKGPPKRNSTKGKFRSPAKCKSTKTNPGPLELLKHKDECRASRIAKAQRRIQGPSNGKNTEATFSLD